MSQEICDELSAALLGDTLAFLDKNVVLMNYNPLDLKQGLPATTRRFDFSKPYATQNGGFVYDPITKAASVINGFLVASFLPWAEDGGLHIVLEPDAGPDLMFTATLTGCAVGYVRAADGAVRDSHHNIQGPDGTDDAAQKRSLAFATGAVHRSQYRSQEADDTGEFIVQKEGVALVYGVRKDAAWQMYAQVLEHGSVYTRETGVTTFNVRIKSATAF
jgi:hypothetical protein